MHYFMSFYKSVKKLYNDFTNILQQRWELVDNIAYILDAIISAEDDAITVIDCAQKVQYWNEAAVKIYQIPQNKILGQRITKFFQEEDLMVLKVLRTKKHVKNIYHRPRKDKHVVINAMPIFNDVGELIGAVSVERDITTIVRLNDNLTMTSRELNELRQKVKQVNEESPFAKIKGKSKALQETIQIARKAAKTDATTLILGESGTGKEVFTRAIHEASDRANKPFIPVNCGAIPPALFESELFGYEAGSFTGSAKEGKAGKIEMADGGTLFLDEIGELPLEMQVKLLRVLQEKRVYRIGDAKGRNVDVRIIAATNQDLTELMAQKQFRQDLYYRLNVIQLTLPPLRERVEDIPLLANLFLQEFATKYQVPTPEIAENAMQILLNYAWPGNVRELKNMMERLIILCEKPVISRDDIVNYFPNIFNEPTPVESKNATLSSEKEAIEKVLIEETLRKTNGNKSDAAKKLGISRMTLYNKIKKYQIDI